MTIETIAKPTVLKSPYPWFGGKSRVSSLVWSRFGEVRNYVEPFFGSGAVLLQRPTPFTGVETINDKDRYVANFWRALKADPKAVAEWCDWPVNEADLHARHRWLIEDTAEFRERMHVDPDYFDVKVAGWWVWGLCQWIGSGWCAATSRQRPHLGDAGLMQRSRQTRDYFSLLADRLRSVRVCCGDWERICGAASTTRQGLTAVFLDPPYSAEANRDESLYAQEDLSVAHLVRVWCAERGNDPKLRIALCGYEGEHEGLESLGWSVVAWKTGGGYGNGRRTQAAANVGRERIWFSPHCLSDNEASATLF